MANEGKVRIQKALSDCGFTSRRHAEEMIREGRIRINGHKAEIGAAVNPDRDVITVDGERVQTGGKKQRVYIALHKPRGYITTLKDEQGRKCVQELVENVGVSVFPIGRLDRESEGLLLFTNDGDFANAVMHPANHIPKLYRVTLREPITDDQQMKFREGIVLDGRRTAPAEIRVVQSEPGRCVVEITLYEGRNRQIRRMCESLGLSVARLRRNAVGAVRLGMLPPGSWRYLTPAEVRALVQATGSQKRIASDYIKNGREPDRDHHNARKKAGR